MNILSTVKNFLGITSSAELYARTCIDISKWQCSADSSKLFNFDTYEKSDGIGIIIKASQGNYYDNRYAYYLANVISRGIFFGTYHFADMRYTAKASAKVWAAQINAIPEDQFGKPDTITRHFLDVENYGFKDKSKAEGKAWVKAFLAEMGILCPNTLIGIYTSYYGWTDNIEYMPEIASRDLWVAHYGDIPKPSIPKEWFYAGKKWRWWQVCDSCTKCGGCGVKYGAASASIDINWFNGAMVEFEAWRDTGVNPEGEEMSSAEYTELKEEIRLLREQLNSHSHGDTPPTNEYTDPYTVTANPSLVLRETPNGGTAIVSIPMNQVVFVKPGVSIADTQGRGSWLPATWNGYYGWLASWYLKKN